MEIKEVLRDIDGQLAYYECIDFLKSMSKVSDINYFIQVMERQEELKSRIEGCLIYLVSKKELEDFEKVFLDKYYNYLSYILEKDVREYYNNKYCSYLYSNLWNNLTLQDNPNDVKFINGKSLSQIDDLLVDKHNQLMKKIRGGEELDGGDRNFLEESFLSMAYDSIVYKEIDGEKDLMYDIVDYFAKYPINDISNERNRQLYILLFLSRRMTQMSSNCAIKFTSERVIEDETEVLGCFGMIEDDGVPCLKVNCLDVYDLKTEREFLRKMFTVFHELGHFMQHIEINEFNDDVKKIILMEIDLVRTHRSFYAKYHDSFFIERDADNYAITEIIKEYGEKYPSIVYDILSREQGVERLDPEVFYLMELEEYEKVILDNQGKKNVL